MGKEPLGHATLMVCVLSFPAKTDTAFKAFLDAQNPRQQHSSTLESYLIKPIQRILKYPLLLRELFALTDAESEEHYHLDGEHPLPPASTPTPPPSLHASTAPAPAWPLHSPLFNACVLLVAIKTMNKVASHINEMQKIHEEFGAVFDQLIAEQTGEKKEVRRPPSHILFNLDLGGAPFPPHSALMISGYEVPPNLDVWESCLHWNYRNSEDLCS